MSRIAVEVQNGRYLDYVPGSDVAVGDVVPLTTFCGVAMTDIPSGTVGTIAAEGVFEVPAVNNAAFAPGDRLYWNAATKKATKTSTDNTPLGLAVAVKAAAGAFARVLLVPLG